MSDIWPDHLCSLARPSDLWGSSVDSDAATVPTECSDQAQSACGSEQGKLANAADREKTHVALERLADSVDALCGPHGSMLAVLLTTTVERLVLDIVGRSAVDGELLLARASGLAAALEGAVDAVLHVHPDDLVHFQDAGVGHPVIGDVAVLAGTVLLRSSGMTLQDGVTPALARLHDAMDAMGLGR